MTTMRRAQAILLIAAMLATPLAVLARGRACCERACCSRTHCPPNAARATHDEDESGMACHQHSAPMPDCSMKSACNHTLEYGFTSPLPPTVLLAPNPVTGPAELRLSAVPSPANTTPGFLPSPFEPPRS